MANADGFSKLRTQIQKLRDLANLTDDVAPAVAKAVKVEIRKQVARGVGPDGAPWKPTKAGTPPLKNAANAIAVRAIGSVVLVRLSGHHARHHLGAVKGKVKREIIPTGKIPDPVTRAIARVVTGEFHSIMETGK